MNQSDIEETIKRYNNRILNMGITEEALGWTRSNNAYRMNALILEWKQELNTASILDFGCGYGELFGFLLANELSEFSYTGIDINSKLILEGKRRYPNGNFIEGGLDKVKSAVHTDFSFCSGVFNHKLQNTDEYMFIFETIESLFAVTKKGVAVNFLSDKVEYHTEHNFNANPGKIIEFCYSLTNNIVLKNDYMPFEFTVFLRKDKVIDRDKLIYK